MRCARSNKEPHTARKGTTTARPWRALSPLEAGSLDTTPQHIKTNCVHHGLDHTRPYKCAHPWTGWLEYRWTLTRAYSTFTGTISNSARLQIPRPVLPDAASGTSIVLSTRAPSTFMPSEAHQNHTESGSTQQTGSVTNKEEDVHASIITDQSEDIHTDTNTAPKSVWDLQDVKCILSKNSECCIDFKGFRFHAMETLFYALQLLTLGDTKYIRQLAKYTQMDFVKICANTPFKLASPTLQDKWLCDNSQHGHRLLGYSLMNINATCSLHHSHDNWPCIDNYYCTLVTIGTRISEMKTLEWCRCIYSVRNIIHLCDKH